MKGQHRDMGVPVVDQLDDLDSGISRAVHQCSSKRSSRQRCLRRANGAKERDARIRLLAVDEVGNLEFEREVRLMQRRIACSVCAATFSTKTTPRSAC